MSKILLYYCFIISLFITVSGVLTSVGNETFLLQLFFLPVTLTLGYAIVKRKIPTLSPIGSKTFLFAMLVFLLLFSVSFVRVLTASNQQASNRHGETETVIPATISPTPTLIKQQFILLKSEYEEAQVNIRKEATLSASIIGKAKYDEQYPVVAKDGEWYEVVLEDKTHGFIHEDFVFEATPEATPGR